MRRPHPILQLTLFVTVGGLACVRLVTPAQDPPFPLTINNLSVLETHPAFQPDGSLPAFGEDTITVEGLGWDPLAVQVLVGGQGGVTLTTRELTRLVGTLPSRFPSGPVVVVSGERVSSPSSKSITFLGVGHPPEGARAGRVEPVLRITGAGTAPAGAPPTGVLAVAFRFGDEDLTASHVALMAANVHRSVIRALPASDTLVTGLWPVADQEVPRFDREALLSVHVHRQLTTLDPDAGARSTTELWGPAFTGQPGVDTQETGADPLGVLPLSDGRVAIRQDGGLRWVSHRDGGVVFGASLDVDGEGPRWGSLPAGFNPSHAGTFPSLLTLGCTQNAAGVATRVDLHHTPVSLGMASPPPPGTASFLRPRCVDADGGADCNPVDACEADGSCAALAACERDAPCALALRCTVDPACSRQLQCLTSATCTLGLGCTSPVTCLAALTCGEDAPCAAAAACADVPGCSARATCLASPSCAARLQCQENAACRAVVESGQQGELSNVATCLADPQCVSNAWCAAHPFNGDCRPLRACMAEMCRTPQALMQPISPGLVAHSVPLAARNLADEGPHGRYLCAWDLYRDRPVPVEADLQAGALAALPSTRGGRMLAMAAENLFDVVLPQIIRWAPEQDPPLRVAPARAPYVELLADPSGAWVYGIPPTGGVVDVLNADGEWVDSAQVLERPAAAWPTGSDATTLLYASALSDSAMVLTLDRAGRRQSVTDVASFVPLYLEQPVALGPTHLWGASPSKQPEDGVVTLSRLDLATGAQQTRAIFQLGGASLTRLGAVTETYAVLMLSGTDAPCAGADPDVEEDWLVNVPLGGTTPAVPTVLPTPCGSRLLEGPTGLDLNGAHHSRVDGALFFSDPEPSLDIWAYHRTRRLLLTQPAPVVTDSIYPDFIALTASPQGGVVGLFYGVESFTFELGMVDAAGVYQRLGEAPVSSSPVAVSPDARRLFLARPGQLLEVRLDLGAAQASLLRTLELGDTAGQLRLDPTGSRLVSVDPALNSVGVLQP